MTNLLVDFAESASSEAAAFRESANTPVGVFGFPDRASGNPNSVLTGVDFFKKTQEFTS